MLRKSIFNKVEIYYFRPHFPSLFSILPRFIQLPHLRYNYEFTASKSQARFNTRMKKKQLNLKERNNENQWPKFRNVYNVITTKSTSWPIIPRLLLLIIKSTQRRQNCEREITVNNRNINNIRIMYICHWTKFNNEKHM